MPLRVHTLPSCDLPRELERGSVALLALGDFEPGNDAAEVLPLGRSGSVLRFPAATQAIVARAGDGQRAFTGYGERRADAGIDLLLWPERQTCAIPSSGYPGANGGQALGFAKDAGLVLVAGGNDALNADGLVGFLSFDAATGAVAAQGRADLGSLAEPRAFATITPFGSQLLVAGGEKPVQGVPERDIEPYASAELFDPARGRFSGESIELQSARTHHAALALEDGRTLLLGGRARVGRTSIAEYRVEIVDPASKRATLADAITPRIEPTALELSDGRILVGGGTALDGSLVTPVLEWLTADARLDQTRASTDVAPRFDRAFVATEGGGALAVGGCEDRPAGSSEDAKRCAQCNHGCVPLDGYDGWWVDGSGAATRVRLDGIVAPRPILLPGSDGSPWLIAASVEAPEAPRLFRFNPWSSSFESTDLPASLGLPRPGRPAPLTIAPDTFVWLDETADGDRLIGLRLGTRNRFAQDLALVLLADPLDPYHPQHLAPSRALSDSTTYDGRLTLRDPDVTIRVTDTDYADVTVELELADATEPPPLVVLGATALGGPDCPWPSGEEVGAEPPRVVRHGDHAVLRFAGGNPKTCSVESGRVTV
ncbi:MAG TPA: hypothetical protein VEQ59_22015, partial [Polyangiaceae bacterium]|nr:hypothetical protein [Polyangiaceae bacterium]